MTPKICARFVALFLLIGLTSCGGGGGGGLLTAVGSGGTGITAGTITGFGSVIVDGNHYPDTTASYDVTSDTSTGTSISPTLAKIGQQVLIATDVNGNATAVHIYPEVVGVVTAISEATDTFTVAGTRVLANATNATLPITAYGGYSLFSDIKINDRVEVHGLPMTDSSGAYVAASRIELKPSSCNGGCAVRVAGTLSQLNVSAQTFTLNGLTVNYSGNTVVTPSGQNLANGERVSVFSGTPLSGATLVASAIAIRNLSTSVGTLRLSGVISNYASNGSFMVTGVTVNASSIVPALTLANGQTVIVSGSFDPGTSQLLATSVAPYGSNLIQSELNGTITNFVSAANFQVRGTLVNASAASFLGGTSANLQNNAYVKIFGTVANNIVKAATVAFQAETNDNDGDLSGVISGYTSPTQLFTITLDNRGTTIQATLTGAPFFIGGVTNTSADLANGQYVTVHAVLVNGQWLINTVTFMLGTQASENGDGTNGSANSKEVQGIANNLNQAASTFRLNGITVNYAGATIIGGGALSNGAEVRVYGTLSGSTLSAVRIAIDQ